MPPQPRHRAQAELETLITAAEVNREKWAKAVAELAARGRPCHREEGMLRHANEKLALFRQSQTVLRDGDQGER